MVGRREPLIISQLGMNASRACRLALLVMCIAGPRALADAHAIAGAGEASAAYELRQHAIAATVLQDDLLALCESASGAEQFELYSIYNRAIGTWLQVDFLRDLLDIAMTPSSPSDEQAIGAALRDQAAFALWEVDQSIAYLEAAGAVAQSLPWSQQAAVLHSLLSQVREVVERLTAER
jgi:hypothetical protein